MLKKLILLALAVFGCRAATPADFIGKSIESAKITSYDFTKYERSALIYLTESKANRAAMSSIRARCEAQLPGQGIFLVYPQGVPIHHAHTLLHRGGGTDWYPRVHFVIDWGGNIDMAIHPAAPFCPRASCVAIDSRDYAPVVLIVDRVGLIVDAYVGWSNDAQIAIANLPQ